MKNRFYTYNRQLFYTLRGDKDADHDAVGVGLTVGLGYDRASLYGVQLQVLYLLFVKLVYVRGLT